MISTLQSVLDNLRRHPSFSSKHSCSIQEVLGYYGSPKLTTTKIIKLFRCDPKSDAERECFKYLVQFVRSLSDGDLEKFLRFSTGFDTIVVDSIDVEFVGTPASASKRPIAHFCAPMVEVLHTYKLP